MATKAIKSRLALPLHQRKAKALAEKMFINKTYQIIEINNIQRFEQNWYGIPYI